MCKNYRGVSDCNALEAIKHDSRITHRDLSNNNPNFLSLDSLLKVLSVLATKVSFKKLIPTEIKRIIIKGMTKRKKSILRCFGSISMFEIL